MDVELWEMQKVGQSGCALGERKINLCGQGYNNTARIKSIKARIQG
jgi:hypothetical protein